MTNVLNYLVPVILEYIPETFLCVNKKLNIKSIKLIELYNEKSKLYNAIKRFPEIMIEINDEIKQTKNIYCWNECFVLCFYEFDNKAKVISYDECYRGADIKSNIQRFTCNNTIELDKIVDKLYSKHLLDSGYLCLECMCASVYMGMLDKIRDLKYRDKDSL
ncbi:MAG: hypothetical protein Edafosvirus10_35 [Edafosvirus sp.]|uniref:Uncharacterized protein n=1 Tax=Edafosvirus sp. TaxID=2487765 RepID=A0A3G4ZTX9_9VIRU|nr:MAG: hypothetical protein Edafosvirus10_35 [Edafosvirus sp.]